MRRQDSNLRPPGYEPCADGHGLSREQARCSLRLTLNEENTAEEVDYIARQLSAAVERLRGLSPRWAEKTAGGENFLLEREKIGQKAEMP